MTSPFPPGRDRLAAIRAALPATRAGIYLNTGTCGPLPAETAVAMAAVAERELTVGRAHPGAYEELVARLDEARAGVAAVLTTDVDLVAITHSTTHGLNLALGSIAWRPGDRAVTTNHEHPGLLAPLAGLRTRFGVEVATADVGDGGDDDRTIAALETALTPATRVIALSHVLWSTGAVLPLARIVALARERGVSVVVDGAQAAGAIPVAADEIGADFYATSGQKWLLGPEGTGALHVRRDLVGSIVPPQAGFYSASEAYGDTLAPDARRFEVAGFGATTVTGLARSIGWLAMSVGLPWAMARAAGLAGAAAEQLAAIPGVTVATPRGRMGTLVAFRVVGWPSVQVVEALAHRVHALTRSVPGHDLVRLSIGFFTSDDELVRVLEAVEEIAAHEPGSLPARPAIEFLRPEPG
ncbi:MAG: aminotransferase class V-fold PLP-dependent enzyme [Chloroflexi bacterium]|nr:aminotransferase class V-fold PLP-dependent enzyme [Chloroflexota bacterium]